ncbi:50S ribosomal protein L15 [candidate division CPR3 bacterium 4484_211]|uniref:Large ribosomal subunit protein uL15 n=1 Tax=candidate division CPR3 bacterium 4484_211 TaxID=1968527 RepID=A0A1W9P125_UNCC3|nr:MAG: 50S ribosomal protein L15 [candidate division CPR3 bacterium 4484_211]
MELHSLPKIVKKRAKRVGRGIGSGRGKTSGRGMKGQKARSKVKISFEGGQLKLTKRLPFVRGRGFKGRQRRPETLPIYKLNLFRAGSKITPEVLKEKGLVSGKSSFGIKILSVGRLEKKFSVRGVYVSRGAREQIEKLGGNVG